MKEYMCNIWQINRARDSAELEGGDRKTIHLTFDYAQPCLLPQFLRQPGGLYFETPIKVQVILVHHFISAVCCSLMYVVAKM